MKLNQQTLPPHPVYWENYAVLCDTPTIWRQKFETEPDYWCGAVFNCWYDDCPYNCTPPRVYCVEKFATSPYYGSYWTNEWKEQYCAYGCAKRATFSAVATCRYCGKFTVAPKEYVHHTACSEQCDNEMMFVSYLARKLQKQRAVYDCCIHEMNMKFRNFANQMALYKKQRRERKKQRRQKREQSRQMTPRQ